MKNALAQRYSRYLRTKLGAIKATPHQIAAGYAVGFLVGTLPIFTLRIGIALLLATLFKWNKPATLLGIFLINPFTGPPYYALAYAVGRLLTGKDTGTTGNWDLSAMWQALWADGAFFLVLSFGCLVVAIPITLFLFWSVRATIIRFQAS